MFIYLLAVISSKLPTINHNVFRHYKYTQLPKDCDLILYLCAHHVQPNLDQAAFVLFHAWLCLKWSVW